MIRIRGTRWLALGIWITTLVLMVVAIVLSIDDPTTKSGDIAFIVGSGGGMLAFGTIGALLARQAPRNPIGWLYGSASLGVVIGICASEYAIRGLTDLTGLPAIRYVAWLNVAVLPIALSLIPIALLLFPDGHLLSRRWRPVLWSLILLAALGTFASAFVQRRIDVGGVFTVENPFRVPVAEIDALWPVMIGLILIGLAGSLGSVVVRYRRSTGDERQQLRWLTAAVLFVGVAAAVVVITGFLPPSDLGTTLNEMAFFAFLIGVAIGFPGATAVAILRYRLYDLDLVVKKTVVFTIVAVFIIVLYVAALALAALSTIGAIAGALIFVLTFNMVRRRARKVADRIVYGERATPFEVMSDFSERVGDTYSVDDVLPRMTELLAGSTGASEARVWLRSGERLSPVAVSPVGAPALPPVTLAGTELPSFADGLTPFAVTHQGELLGAITLRMPPKDPMDPAKARLVNGLASQAGLALRNVGLVQDLRESRRRIVAAQDERAKALERNIHDGAQQQLVALSVKLRLAQQLVERDPAKAQAILGELQGDATNALEDLRDLARGIYPPLLADKGLPDALAAQARKSATPITVEPDGIGRYTPEVEATVYFCCLEAMQNIAKYAAASRSTIRLAQREGVLVFEVTDDGVGFDVEGTLHGSGLQGMADRLDAVGGKLEVRSGPGAGTTVMGRVPATVDQDPD